MAQDRSRNNAHLPDGTPVTNRMQALIDGTLQISELDDEELLKGKLRNKAGNFGGRPGKAIPREFHTAIVREITQRADRRILPRLEESQDVIREIMLNKRAPAIARFTAAAYTWERIQGKIPDKLIQETTIRKFEDLIDGGKLLIDLPDPKAIDAIKPGEGSDADVVDAEIVEDTPPKHVRKTHRRLRQ